jgi:hypothetical protein
VLRTGVSELDEINLAKEAFARAEEHWGYRQIQLIDESGAKILLNGGDAASDTNVFPIRGRHYLLRNGDTARYALWRCSPAFMFRTCSL